MSSRPLIQIIPDANIPVIWETTSFSNRLLNFPSRLQPRIQRLPLSRKPPNFPNYCFYHFLTFGLVHGFQETEHVGRRPGERPATFLEGALGNLDWSYTCDDEVAFDKFALHVPNTAIDLHICADESLAFNSCNVWRHLR